MNRRLSPIQDTEIERYLLETELYLEVTLDAERVYANADYVIVATPTNYEPVKNFFDTPSPLKQLVT